MAPDTETPVRIRPAAARAWCTRDDGQVEVNAYAVIIDARSDRSLTAKQADMLTLDLAGPGKYSAAIACESVTRYLRFTVHVDAGSMPDAVTEALRVTGRAARKAGFGYEAEELRVLPSARLEEETMRLLSA